MANRLAALLQKWNDEERPFSVAHTLSIDHIVHLFQNEIDERKIYVLPRIAMLAQVAKNVPMGYWIVAHVVPAFMDKVM